MDEEIGEVPYASEVWMATHGFLDEQGQTQWHDPESSRIYVSILTMKLLIFLDYIYILNIHIFNIIFCRKRCKGLRNNQQMIMRLVLL